MTATAHTQARLYEQFAPEEKAALWLEAAARGDDAEARRPRDTCPRRSYTQQDAAFADRLEVAFDILAVVLIDLRCLWSKIQTLDWVAGEVKELATLHHITADLAFLDGSNCAKGLPQYEFFRKPLRDFEAEAAAAAEGQLAEPDDEDDEDDDDEDEQDDPNGGNQAGGCAGDAAVRMEAVERRSEHNSALTMFVISQVSLAAGRQLLDVWTAFDNFCRARLRVAAKTVLDAWGVPLADDFDATLKRLDFLEPDEGRVKEYLGLINTGWNRRFSTDSGEEG